MPHLYVDSAVSEHFEGTFKTDEEERALPVTTVTFDEVFYRDMVARPDTLDLAFVPEFFPVLQSNQFYLKTFGKYAPLARLFLRMLDPSVATVDTTTTLNGTSWTTPTTITSCRS
jgi:hypothetical protein